MFTSPETTDARLRQALEATGHRFTEQRAAVYRFLSGTTSHPNADEVFQEVRARVPGISLATVYKSLETLVSCGLAMKLSYSDGSARYDGRTDPHHHARCISCGRVQDVPGQLNRGDLESFWKKLPDLDADFEKQRSAAEAQGKVLRFMASLKEGKCAVGIAEVPTDHVLSRADGTDNIIRITTKRYYDNPMTVQGPGAGREVTAGGIFANVINLSFHLP